MFFKSIYEKQIRLTRLKGFSIKNVLKLISYNPSTTFNINSMANKIFEESKFKPDHTQLKMIIQFLIDSSLIYKIEDKITADRISKKSKYKLYVADWNLFKYFSGKEYKDLTNDTIPKKGLIFENMIISNVMAHSNLLINREKIKTLVDKPDVDLIINDIKIEIKSFDALDKNHQQYQTTIDKALETNALIVHMGKTTTFKINAIQSIKYINVKDFLINIKTLSKII